MTPYSEVFKSFLGKIQDDLYVFADEDVIQNDLVILLNDAIVSFSYPRVDVRDKNDATFTFNVTLTLDEVEIIALAMVVAWTERELHSVDMLRQSMTTKDFNTYSQASHINALIRTADRAEKKLKKRLVKYSIRKPDGTPGFDSLGGD